ncbi:MAG: hypothetical protein ACTSXD_09950 [Candidatus Heimdallarchaeaceae archaeon]
MSYAKIECDLSEPALFLAEFFELVSGEIDVIANYILPSDALGFIGPVSSHILFVEDPETNTGIIQLSNIEKQKEACSNLFKEGYESGVLKSIYYFMVDCSYVEPENTSKGLHTISFQGHEKKLTIHGYGLSEKSLSSYLENLGIFSILEELNPKKEEPE